MTAVPRTHGLVARSALRFLCLTCLFFAGCVVGAPRPSSRIEIARAPVSRVDRESSVLPPAGGCSGAESKPEQSRPAPPTKDAVWVEGFCHFDVTHYTWVDGNWRTR
jgi:hypothetical protein